MLDYEDYYRSQGLVPNADGTEWVKPNWVDAQPLPVQNYDPAPADRAAFTVARAVKRSNPLPVADDRGHPFGPLNPEAPSYLMEPDLQETQGGMQLPGNMYDTDSGVYFKDTNQPVPIVRRPGLLPIANSPEGLKLVMPKALDLLGNVMGNVGGKVTAKSGEMVLGSGMVRPTIEATKSTTPFYSQLERTVENAKINLATPEQWLGYLKNQPGVKAEELNHVLGDLPKEGMLSKEQLADYVKQNKVELKEKVLGDNKQTIAKLNELQPNLNKMLQENDNLGFSSVTEARKAIISDHPKAWEFNKPEDLALAEQYHEMAKNSEKPTQYHQYQLSGGENYKEILLSLPEKTNPAKLRYEQVGKRLEEIQDRFDELYKAPDSAKLAKERQDLANEKKTLSKEYGEIQQELFNSKEDLNYKAPHFNEHGTNLIGHSRSNERTLPIEFTAEEKAALQKHDEAQPYLDKLQQSQRDVALAIGKRTKPLEDFRQGEIRKDLKAGKISLVEANKQFEKYVEYPTIKPLQDKLEKLREEENNVRKALPEKPQVVTEKGKHIEELQSDWAQNIRDKGFKGEKEKLEPEFNKIEEKLMATNDDKLLGLPTIKQVLAKAVEDGHITKQEAATYKRYTDIENATPVPDMPFKKNWDEVLIKREIYDAVQKGHKFITVTPGEAQALRYQNEIRQKIDTIRWVPREGKAGERVISVKPTNGGSDIYLDIDKYGNIVNGPSEAKGKDLSEVIGKDIARQILEKPEGNIDAKGYVMGAEGMKGYYDKMVVDKFNNIGKKYGAKMEPFGKVYGSKKPKFDVVDGQNNVLKTFDSEAEANAFKREAPRTREVVIGHYDAKQPVHYFPITPELEKKAREGFELFSTANPTLIPVDRPPEFDNQEKPKYKLVPVQGNPFQ